MVHVIQKDPKVPRTLRDWKASPAGGSRAR